MPSPLNFLSGFQAKGSSLNLKRFDWASCPPPFTWASEFPVNLLLLSEHAWLAHRHGTTWSQYCLLTSWGSGWGSSTLSQALITVRLCFHHDTLSHFQCDWCGTRIRSWTYSFDRTGHFQTFSQPLTLLSYFAHGYICVTISFNTKMDIRQGRPRLEIYLCCRFTHQINWNLSTNVHEWSGRSSIYKMWHFIQFNMLQKLGRTEANIHPCRVYVCVTHVLLYCVYVFLCIYVYICNVLYKGFSS